jgi:hypothetical protein
MTTALPILCKPYRSSMEVEGCGDRREASAFNAAKSPRMKASFFARLHFFSLRSFSMASVTRSNHCEKTSVTGHLVEV